MNMNVNENPTQFDAEAAEWLIELRDPEYDSVDAEAKSVEREAAFLDWMALSPSHVLAFENASRTFGALDKLRSLQKIDVRQLINDHSSDVIPLYPTSEYVKDGVRPINGIRPPRTDRQRRWLSVRNVFAAAACIGALGVAVVTAWTQTHSREFVTAVGEQRTIRLDDGSIVHLNTDSRLQIHFTQQAREIALLKGEALFEVVHNAARPFVVSTGTATIRDVGTTFDVYKHADAATTVAVVDGAVRVAADSGSDVTGTASITPDAVHSDDTRLTAGEQASVAGGLVVKESKPDVSRALAWRERTLSFSGASLAEVASEFNRYNKTQIRIEGDAVRERQLSGVFSADHPQSMILFLAKDESLSVVPEGDSWIVRAR
jgi:transmembrane sensor